MGILDKFQTPKDEFTRNGSEYGPKYTATGKLPTSVLAGDKSPLHAKNGTEGYSLNGVGEPDVQKLYNEYDDGQVNALPPASTLDDIYKHKYNSFNVYTNPEITKWEESGEPNPLDPTSQN